MKKLLIFALLTVSVAWGQDAHVKSVSQIKTWCDAYLVLESTSHVLAIQASDGGLCEGYIVGLMEQVSLSPVLDIADGASVPNGKFLMGAWGEAVTADQVTRVFMKLVNDQPQWLDKPAYLAIEKACMDNGLLTYKQWSPPHSYVLIPADGKHPLK
ncbi:MAG: hypothetical protein WBM24_03445 [Candidatus Sulfotelmatobacter sp.]